MFASWFKFTFSYNIDIVVVSNESKNKHHKQKLEVIVKLQERKNHAQLESKNMTLEVLWTKVEEAGRKKLLDGIIFYKFDWEI